MPRTTTLARLLTPVIAFTVLIGGVHAGPAMAAERQTTAPSTVSQSDAFPAVSVGEMNAMGAKVFKDAETSLSENGSFTVKGADGVWQTIAIADNGDFIINGKVIPEEEEAAIGEVAASATFAASGEETASATAAAAKKRSWACKIKIGSAWAAIAAVGVAFISYMIQGVAAATFVRIAGITFRAETWNLIRLGWGATGVITGYLERILC